MLLKEDAFIKKKYTRMFIASFFGYAIILLSEMFDSFAAGIYIDSIAVAGIELVKPFEYVYYSISMLFAYGIGILYLREVGKHDKVKSGQIAGMGLIITIVLGLLFFIPLYFFPSQILSIFDSSLEVKQAAITYLKTEAYSMPFYPAYWFFSGLIECDGDEKLVLAANFATSLITMILPGIFARYWGISGISIVRTIVYAVGVSIELLHFLSKRNSIKFLPYFSFKDLYEDMKISSVYALTNVYVAVVDIIINYQIIKQFTDAFLPTYVVVNCVLNLAETLTCGMNAGIVFISIAYGEKNYDAIKRFFKMAVTRTIILSLFMIVFTFIFAPLWPNLLGIEDIELAKMAVFAGRVIPFSYVIIAIIVSLCSYYTSIEKPLYGNILAALYMLVCPLIICLPLCYTKNFYLMIVGFTLAPLLTLIIMYLFFVITGKIKQAPLFLPPSSEKEIHYNIELKQENIIELRDKLMDDLKSYNVSSNIITEISAVIEDTLVFISGYNNKTITSEVSVLFNDQCIRLIIKDDGQIIDLVEKMSETHSLRAYVLDRLTSNAFQKDNDIAISFNRNMFSWQVNK